MDLTPRITRVVLENYKSIAFCDVRLGPLTILVGPNGAGKSNFLDALRFLSQATTGPTSKAFHDRGGFFRVIRRRIATNAHIGIRIEFVIANGVSGFYAARFRRWTRADYVVAHERCWLDVPPPMNGYEITESNRVLPNWVPGQNVVGLDQLHLPIAASLEVFKPVFDLLQGCHFYNFNPRDFRRPVAYDPSNTLSPDGANLANVLNRMALQHPDAFSRVVEYLRVILPSLERVEAVDIQGYSTLVFQLSQAPFSPEEISDGTLRSLGVLITLFQRRGGAFGVQLVGIEEPEAAVHPAAAGVLFDAMQEASASVQVMAATHSADLLDKDDIDSEAILSVELEDGVTKIGHVDETGRKALRERLYTAGELMRMKYLRPVPQMLPSEIDVESRLFGDLVPA